MLFEGIIVLVIGIILFAIRGLLPVGAQKFAEIGGLILCIIGIILIIIGALGVAFLSLGAIPLLN